VSDPKYDGVRTTRDKIFGDDEDEDMRDESENGEAPLSLHDDDGDGDDDGEEEEDGSEEESEEEKEQRGSKRKSSPSGEDNAKASPEDEALVRSLQRTRIAEKEKGQAVKQQLVRSFILSFCPIDPYFCSANMGFPCRCSYSITEVCRISK